MPAYAHFVDGDTPTVSGSKAVAFLDHDHSQRAAPDLLVQLSFEKAALSTPALR